MTIRPATESDRGAIWTIFHEVVTAGETYPFDPNISREDGLNYWFQKGSVSYVAEIDGSVVGSYMIRPNQPSLGAHIANAAYMVSSAARGQRVGRRLCEHSLTIARELGYRGMQYNLVIATNTYAIKLYLSLGFEIIGTLPGVFKHLTLGYVDAHVMFKKL